MLILASSSPRRKELLKKITTDFVVISPDIDEGALSFVPAKDLAAEESKEKAYAIKAKYPNDEIISCDTIVVLESGEVLGKPGNAENARKMLENESGKKQYVLSGYTYIGKGVEITRTVKSVVYFNKLSPELIEEYIETTSWASQSKISRSIALSVREDSFIHLLGVILNHKGEFFIHLDVTGNSGVLQ